MDIFAKEITDNISTQFLIKFDENTNFKNTQFSNEAFKKVRTFKGFKPTEGGLGFCIELTVDKPIIFKSRLEEYENKVSELRTYAATVKNWIENNINKSVSGDIVCPICGFDEFGKARLNGMYATYLLEFKGDRENEKDLSIRFCKKCRVPIILESER